MPHDRRHVLTDTALVTVDITPAPCMVETTGDALTDYSSADASAPYEAIVRRIIPNLLAAAGHHGSTADLSVPMITFDRQP